MLIGRNNSDSREVPNTWLAEYRETSGTRRRDGTHCKKGHRRKVNKVTNTTSFSEKETLKKCVTFFVEYNDKEFKNQFF